MCINFSTATLGTESLALCLVLEKGLKARFLLGKLLGAKDLLDLGILRLGLGLAILHKGRELVLVRLLAKLAVVHLCLF